MDLAALTYFGPIAVLIVLDLLTGVLSAAHRQVFSWKHIGDILPKGVLAALVTLVAQSVATGAGADPLVNVGIFGVFAATTVSSIVENVQEVTGIQLLGWADFFTNWVLSLVKGKNTPVAKPPTSG